jgi:hypothetical protein
MNLSKVILVLLCGVATAQAQLAVTVSRPKVVGQKAVVPLALKNGLGQKVESARAAVFLLDDQGKVVGQGSQWVVGGTKDRPALASGATNAFHFVITSDKPFTTTNLTVKVSFTRVVLEGGKLADPQRDVHVAK